eukprot:3561352-Prymnesium_polylepis.1
MLSSARHHPGCFDVGRLPTARRGVSFPAQARGRGVRAGRDRRRATGCVGSQPERAAEDSVLCHQIRAMRT